MEKQTETKKYFSQEMLLCMLNQGYESHVVDFCMGKVDFHIYNSKKVRMLIKVERVKT